MSDELETRNKIMGTKREKPPSAKMSDEAELSYKELAKKTLSKPEGLTILARYYTPMALQRLLELVNSYDDKVALGAIKLLLERGWGSSAVVAVQETAKLSDKTLKERIAEVIGSREKEVIQLPPDVLIEPVDVTPEVEPLSDTII